MGADSDVMRWMYRKMLEIRYFEEAAIDTYRRRLWKGSLHACVGQEANAVGAAAAVESSDYFVSTHRGHGHLLAKGLEPRLFMAELFGRETGYCRGRGGSMHAMCAEKRVYPNGLVGSSAYIAAGIGMAARYTGTPDVVVCFLGDGAVNTGGAHEGMNLAAIRKAPVVFLCENNRIAVSTRIEGMIATPQISDRAAAYGMSGETIDGTDAVAVYEAVKRAAAKARGGGGPSFIEALCFRAGGHTAWDASAYRTREENEAWKAHDPIPKLRDRIVAEGRFTAADLSGWDREIGRLVAEAVAFAEASPAHPLTREEALKYVFATEGGSR